MATVTLSDGRKIKIPDGLQPDQVKKIIDTAGQQKPEESGFLSDMWGAVKRGVPEGALMLGNTMSDVSRMGEDAIASAFGIKPEQMQAVRQARSAVGIGSPVTLDEAKGKISDTIRPAPSMSQLITGERPRTFLDYEPKTEAGQWALTGSQMAAGAALGPGGVASKVGGVLGGTLGAESLDELAERYAPQLRPYAKILGGVLGGGVGSGLGEYSSIKPPAGMTRGSAALLREATPDDIGPYRRLGDDAMVLDAGPSTTGLAMGVAAQPGRNSDTIVNAVTGRNDTRSTRLLEGTANVIGKPRDPEYLKRALDRAGQRRAGPLYTDAKQNAPQLPTSLQNLTRGNVRTTTVDLSKTRREGANQWIGKIDDALRAKDPTVTASRLHDLRQELDILIVWDKRALQSLPSADKSMQSVYKDIRGTVDDILKNRLGFDVPDEIVSTAKKAQDDIDFGYGALDAGKSAIPPKTFAAEARKRTTKFVNEGIKADIANAMGTNSNDLAALKRRVGGENGWNRDKLARQFGQQKVDALGNLVDRESTFAQNYADVTRNSMTARRQAAGKIVDGLDKPVTDVSTTTTGLALKTGEKIVRALLSRAASYSGQRNKDALTRALVTSGKDGEALMRTIQKLPKPTSVAIIQALLAGRASAPNPTSGQGPR